MKSAFARVSAARVLPLLSCALLACAKIADLGGSDNGGNADPNVTDPQSESRIAITPTTLDFGNLACGTTSPGKLITIQNRGAMPVPYKAILPAGTSFRLDGDVEGTLAPKATVNLSLSASPLTAGDNTTDLSITAGDRVQSVRATAKGAGSTFELGQSVVAFGDVRKESGAGPIEVVVTNNGTETLSVSGFTSSNPAFDVRWANRPGAFTVAPKKSAPFTVSLTKAVADDSAVLESAITPVAQRLCGSPQILTVSGRRVTSEVTINPADWGKENCNTNPESKTITITNYSTSEVRYSLTLQANSAFTIVSAGPGIVNAAASADAPQVASVEIVPKRLKATAPLQEVNELLGVTLESDAPGVSGLREVPLHVDVRGAILVITPASLSFRSNGTLSDTRSFNVTNAGNKSIGLSWNLAATSATGKTGWTYSAPSILSPGASLEGAVTFKTSEVGTSTATLTASQSIFSLVTGEVLCQPPAPIALSGTNP